MTQYVSLKEETFEEQKKRLQKELGTSSNTILIYLKPYDEIYPTLISSRTQAKHLEQYIKNEYLCPDCCNHLSIVLVDVKTGSHFHDTDKIPEGTTVTFDLLDPNTGEFLKEIYVSEHTKEHQD